MMGLVALQAVVISLVDEEACRYADSLVDEGACRCAGCRHLTSG